ncbi:hypothetical protein MKK67_06840 [Methylobacterium sp. J-072]|uniref:hypothetical protein n=1 Tax=Methylobacterium sp. J-072 TaxID=2836651 RepID=UPI001FBB4281|nr:hypothetical protein [Methylobacterium sp. J-072]MCJ2092213.1 hypothetical protein [Methylobacterium sp. J-072]
MSEYQYYEFLAIDRRLDESDRKALRALSTRATITATRFVNTYQWGDFKGDPAKLMERWFDLHLYFANWGTRRLMLRLPERFVDVPGLGRFLDAVDEVTIRRASNNVIFDILSECEEPDDDIWYDDEDDESDEGGRLAELAPLRADLIDGDLRLFYLLWLKALEADALDDATVEPLPGIGPLTDALAAFAEFFRIDPDLVAAAAEIEASAAVAPSARALEAAVAGLPEAEKTAFLVRLVNADPHAGTELKRLLRHHLPQAETASQPPLRNVGALRARAEAIRHERDRAEAEAAEARRRREAEEAEKQRRVRLDALARRGEAVWREIETEIDRRNASGYTKAFDLLSDLKILAAERGLTADFDMRLAGIRQRHGQKGRFLERLAAGGL